MTAIDILPEPQPVKWLIEFYLFLIGGNSGPRDGKPTLTVLFGTAWDSPLSCRRLHNNGASKDTAHHWHLDLNFSVRPNLLQPLGA